MNLFIYESNTVDFTSRGLGTLSDVILDTPPLVREKLNAEYSLEFDYPYDGRNFDLIKEERIVKASTPQGPQPFRIYKIKKDLDYITVFANHLVYDLGGNWIEDTFIQKKSGQEAINQLLSKCIIPHNFKASSNIAETLSSRLIRKNPIEAMIGDKDNSLLNRGGGEFGFDNFNITWMARRGKDRGFSIKYRKNLIGLDFTTDLSSVTTKIQPIGFDGLLLPEKYVDSTLINKYAVVKTKEIKYEDVISKKLNPDHEDSIDHEAALSKLREYARKEFENGIDKPSIDCTVNFIDLRQTEEYKNYEHLQDLQLGDDVYIEASKYNVKIKKRMTYYEWNTYHERYELITLNEGAEASYNMGLTGTINSIVNNKLEDIYTQVNSVRLSADGKTKIYTGPDKPLNAQKGDIWFRVEADGTETLLRFDGIDWIDPLKLDKLKKDLEESQLSIQEAQDKANKAYEEITSKIPGLEEDIKSSASSILNQLNNFKTTTETSITKVQNDITSFDEKLKTKADSNAVVDIKKTVDGIQGSIKETNSKVDNLQVGGRNLILDADKDVSNANYILRQLIYTEPLIYGEYYTIAIKGELSSKSDGWYINVKITYPDGSYTHPEVTRVDKSYQRADGWFVRTFKLTNTELAKDVKQGPLGYIYATPLNNPRAIDEITSIDKIKLERGTFATDFTLAPEDMASQENLNEFKKTAEGNFNRISTIENDLSSGDTYKKIQQIEQTSTSNKTLLAKVKETADGAVQITTYNNKISTIDKDISTLMAKTDSNDPTSIAYKLNETVKTVDGNFKTIKSIETDLTSGATYKKINEIKENTDGMKASLAKTDGIVTSLSTWKKTADSEISRIATLDSDFRALDIGGRNLFKNSANPNWELWVSWDAQKKSITKTDIYMTERKEESTLIGYYSLRDVVPIIPEGSSVSVSFDVKNELVETSYTNFILGAGFKDSNVVKVPGQKLMRVKLKAKVDYSKSDTLQIQVFGAQLTSPIHLSKFDHLKVEFGNVPTDWSPAPEDLMSVTSFNEFKRTTDQTLSIIRDNKLTSQINQEARQVLISAGTSTTKGKLQITDAGAYMEKSFIKEAHIADASITNVKIQSLSASKITFGTLDGRKANIIYLNASNITSGILSGGSFHLNLTNGYLRNGGLASSNVRMEDGVFKVYNGSSLESTIDSTGMRVYSNGIVNGTIRTTSFASSAAPTFSIIHSKLYSFSVLYENGSSSDLYVLYDKYNTSGKLTSTTYPIEFRESVLFSKPLRLTGISELRVATDVGMVGINNSQLGESVFIGALSSKNGILIGSNGIPYIRSNGNLKRIATV